MESEVKKYVIVPRMHDVLRGDAFRVGCYKFNGSLCGFSGVIINKEKVSEYSFTKQGATIPSDAIEVSSDIINYFYENLKHIYVTVDGLINRIETDANSKCYVLKNYNHIFLVNESPDSEWHNYELIRGEIPSILIPSDLIIEANKNTLKRKPIPELLFFQIMNYISHSLKLQLDYIKLF